jgi:hypothetical protein
MGGRGSGTWIRATHRAYLDDHIRIDAQRWAREGLLADGRSFVWEWLYDETVTNRISVAVGEDHIVLRYRHIDLVHRRQRDVEQKVHLLRKPCHLGGTRLYITCPSCGRRALKLHLFDAMFVCRTCCALPYKSQSETDQDRAMRKARRLGRRLGLDAALGGDISRRPKWMRQRTFKRLRADIFEAQIRVMQGLLARS